MNGLKRALISMAVMIPGLMTVAETAQTLSLDEAVGQALRGNPRLIALGHQRDAMRERPAQAAGLPNPILTYRGMDAADAATFPPTGEKRFEMEQPLPGYGKRDLRKAMAVNAAAGITAEAEAMAREVVLMVKETAFEWQAVRNAHAITRDEEALLSRMAKVTEARYAAGEAAQTDVIKAYMELTLIRQKQIEWEGRDKTLKARLAQLMGRDAGTMPAQIEASMPDGAAPDPAPRIKEALGARAEIRAARLTVERSELQRRLMARESEPDFKVGLEYRSIERGEDMVMFMVGVDLPLWRSKNRAALREAGMMAAASEADLDSLERQVILDVQSACYKIETARRTLDLYRKELKPQADVRLHSSEAAYRAGKTDFNDWLESERFCLNVRTMAAMAEAEVGTGWARLERATGGVL